jgi:hypothetical protein
MSVETLGEARRLAHHRAVRLAKNRAAASTSTSAIGGSSGPER